MLGTLERLDPGASFADAPGDGQATAVDWRVMSDPIGAVQDARTQF